MKFTFNWLKQYVDFDWSPLELAEKLTFAGIEVEEVVTVGGGPALAAVIVCQILASEKHPNADRLSVCRVTDGKIERQIVCGAKNYKVGDKVPLALAGVTLPNGLTIKEAKLRGVESQGMMCSAKELGLAEDAEGLLILPPETPLGGSLSEALGGADTVFDVEITPNRPDWLSVIGIAREIAAITGNPLRLPEIAITEGAESVGGLANVTLAAPELCPRYTARVVRGVKIAPSPAWLKQAIEKVGLRSINNVVDVTNYVLLECGHPLHAFDYNLLGRAGDAGGATAAQRQIVVRRASEGEPLTVIDGSKQTLTSEMLVITDGERPVALAGIMGGQESEINERTTDVLLESAWFLPANIRKTSKRLGLASESSYRFERGADIDGVIWANNRAAALIQQVAGGQIARGVVDALARPIEKRRVRCRFAQVNRLLGIEVPPATVTKIFTGLGLAVVEDGAAAQPASAVDAVEVEVPTFRVDLEREVDLIEEVCCIYGVEKIPAAMQPRSGCAVSDFDADWDARGRVRAVLTGLGFHEAANQTLGGDGVLKLQNPLSADQHALRSHLVPGLLANLRTNVARHQYDVRLFEIGRVFGVDGGESWHLALALTGRRDPEAWEQARRNERMDFFDLKGALEELFQALAPSPAVTLSEVKTAGGSAGASPYRAPTPAVTLSDAKGPSGETTEILRFAQNDTLLASVRIGEAVIGGVACGSPARMKKLDLRDAVLVAELELAPLLAAAAREKQFRELPKFPAVVRDMALIVGENVTHGEIMAVLERDRNKNLERVELFDIFRGGSIPQGSKSMAYSLTFRAADRTLTDAEVNGAHEQLKRRLQQAVPCEIREG